MIASFVELTFRQRLKGGIELVKIPKEIKKLIRFRLSLK